MERFWHNILPHKRNTSWENISVDVVVKGCFDYYDTTACIRSSLLTLVGFITLLLCTFRIVKLHILHHPQIHQYLVFYSASFELLCLIVKWMAVNGLYQLEYVASYLKMIQFILLCHFHWSLVSRILHQQKLITWIIIPLLVGFLSVYSSITALALLTRFSPSEECLVYNMQKSKPKIVISGSNSTHNVSHQNLDGRHKYSIPIKIRQSCCSPLDSVVFHRIFGDSIVCCSGIYITRKINSISAMDSFKWEQKRDLWSVIVIYQLSSIASLAYFISLQALGSSSAGCSEIFNHAQNIYSPVYATFMIIKYILPILVMLFVFYPTRGCLSSEDERLLGWSCDGSTTSVFSPSTRFMDSYKQLILPIQNLFVTEQPVLRRSASSQVIISGIFW
ncbi:uncharacterized protein CEXT_575711 [Caerostris extrusa]|uniref:Uncharacterized protein n=1 Tax=Caerostris extrusa TaxID=172846 RepID=A0AAV4XLZ1_CAEEX|nr:uncharacterized protein CEXT_575711 [Caerostris extrusa]